MPSGSHSVRPQFGNCFHLCPTGRKTIVNNCKRLGGDTVRLSWEEILPDCPGRRYCQTAPKVCVLYIDAKLYKLKTKLKYTQFAVCHSGIYQKATIVYIEVRHSSSHLACHSSCSLIRRVYSY